MSIEEKAYREIVDLFARGSSSREIIAFHPSLDSQQRVSYLLQQNREGKLTKAEAVELDKLVQLEHMMQLVKAQARSYAAAK